MLQAVLEYINNWFERESYGGEWAVEGGALTRNPGLLDGQYYRVVGSVFNDGLHLWPTTDAEGAPDEAAPLRDESFAGEVRALAVPSPVVMLASEIADWCAANAQQLASPYSSESFGGYSYSKGRSSSEGGAGGDYSWRDHFRSALSAWRKL